MSFFEDIVVGTVRESDSAYELTPRTECGEVIETRASTSKPHLGIIQTRLTLLNQRRETVVSFRAAAMLRRRPQES